MPAGHRRNKLTSLLNLRVQNIHTKHFSFSTSSIVSFILDEIEKARVAIDIREPTVYTGKVILFLKGKKSLLRVIHSTE